LPFCPEVTEIQPSLVDADQLQPVRVETPKERWPPAAPMESLDRLREMTQGAPA
jgi:hypothetical protein